MLQEQLGEQSPNRRDHSRPLAVDTRRARTTPTEKSVNPQTDLEQAKKENTSERHRAVPTCCLFWRHYSVLMWKNFILRRRRPGFLVAELLTPVLITAIILILCTREKDVFHPNCYSQTISMPSMGLLKFVQSMLCNFAYSCSVTEPPPLQLWANKTAIEELFDSGQMLIEDSWIQGVLSGGAISMPDNKTFTKLELFLSSMETVLQEFSQKDGDSWQPEHTNETITILGLNISLSLLNRIGNASRFICGTEPTQNDIGQIANFLKALNGSTKSQLASSILTRVSRSVDENKQPNSSESTTTTTTKSSTTTDSMPTPSAKTFCKKMIEYLNFNPIQPYTNRLNYFLFGYIYYYPSSPVTDEIMRRATALHRLMLQFKQVLEHFDSITWPNLNRVFRNSSKVEKFRQLMKICIVTGSPLSSYCRDAWNFLDPNAEDSETLNIFYLLDQIRVSTRLILNVLKCINLQKRLIPTSTRKQFDEFLVLFQRPTFPSAIGVDFQRVPSTLDWTNLKNSSEHVFEIALRKIEHTYKFKVFDRYWSPRPRQNPRDGDMNYITGGFIDVQETISQAIVSMAWSRPDLLQRSANPQELFNDPIAGQELKLFPTQCYVDRAFLASMAKMLPQLLLFMWVFTAMFTAKAIVEEKEQRLKEFTKVMGVSNITHWIAWFSMDMLIMLPCTILITIMLKYGQMLRDSDYAIILLFFISYMVSVIALTFLCSTFFTHANLGAVVTGMVYFIFYLPTPMILANDANLPEGAYYGASLSSQTAFCLGMYYMLQTESQGRGMFWSEMWTRQYSTTPFSVGKCMLMLWVDTSVYLILTWYIEAVHPGKYGVRQPFYFPFTRAYWCGSKVMHTTDPINEETEEEKDSRFFELPPKNATVGIAVQKLTKIYKKGNKPSLDGLTINFYANQVTSLLGHNGAGKSTLISILTGMLSPSSGKAIVAGYDIRKQLRLVQDTLGFCPQYNILFDNLTVAEHIRFYAALKGIDRPRIQGEIDELMDILGFPDKRNDRSKSLSGGQKRKLSVAIAFVGQSKVVFLDEPTAGVDPYSRRSIWDLVIALKLDRTIILTTHHMDEADILGDRIAIIAQGRLKCEGSSLFLKVIHGQGYHLILERACDTSDLIPEDCRSNLVVGTQEVIQYVQRYMPQAKLVSVSPTELTLNLPSHYALDGTFSTFFRHLESNPAARIPNDLSNLGIVAYSLSDTSLEEVFIEMADDPANQRDTTSTKEESIDAEDTEDNEDDGMLESAKHAYFVRRRSQLSTLRQSSRLQQFTDGGQLPAPATRHSLLNRKHIFRHPAAKSEPVSSGLNKPKTASNNPIIKPQSIKKVSVAQQFRAMFPKRFHYFKRCKRGWFIEFLLPVLLVLLAMGFVSIVISTYNNPPMPLSPWLMAPTEGVLNTFYENHMYATEDLDLTEHVQALRLIRQVAVKYENALREPYGWTGTRCIPKQDYQFIPEAQSSCAKWTELPAWSPESELSPFERQLARNSSQVVCSCSDGIQKCPYNSIRPNPPPHVSLQTTDVLYNISAYNVSDYLMKTAGDFGLRRFGGLSFIVSPYLTLRGKLEQFLNPENPMYKVLGNLTPIQNEGSKRKSDPVWALLANTFRLMLPPTHHMQIWFNNKGYVSAVAYLNMLQNMQLRMVNGSNTASRKSYGLVIINHPLDLPEDATFDSSSNLIYDVTLALFTILALSFIPASFITFLVTEVNTGSKHLQFVSGLNSYVYWASAYIWDVINYTIPATLCILVFVAFKKYAYIGADSCGAFITLMLFYGLAALPMLYPVTFFIRTPSTALVIVAVFNLMIGCLTVMATYLLDYLQREQPTLELVNNVLKGLFLIFPQYCLGRGLYDLALRYYIVNEQTFGLIDMSIWENAFGWYVTGRNLLALGLEAICYSGLVILIEHEFFRSQIREYFHRRYAQLQRKRLKRLQKRLAKLDHNDVVVADDVKEEQQRVFKLEHSGELHSNSSVSTLRLVKFFPRKKKPAVNRLTFALRPSECFGLLGVNGAGKTTTFRMLTGSLVPTLGNAFVNGYNVISQKYQAHRSLGYCPQFDALLDLLTGRETLILYARLRGIPEKEIPDVVAHLLTDMSLDPHADKTARAYSGGNRRKLSTAIALIGEPQVIFLDEPTSGMDPVGKRFLWDQIINLLHSGKSIVLTSHSMEECEALCHRMGIMVNGQFRCFGTVQQLKDRFGNGYTAELRVSDRYHAGEHVEQIMRAEFVNVEVNNTRTRCHEYQFGHGILLSRLFTVLNKLRKERWIEHFSVRQTTLDQVFVNFTRLQMEQGEDTLTESETTSITTTASSTTQLDEVITDDTSKSCRD